MLVRIKKTNKLKKGIGLLASMIVFTTATGLVCSSSEVDDKALKPMPDFKLTYLDGTPFDSRSLEGKVLFVDFWATWCGPCLHEIPKMIEIWEKYKDKGFDIVGITVQSGSAEDILPTVEKLEMEYHVLLGNEEVMEAFGGIYGFPTNFLVTKNGKIFKKYLGVYPNKEKIVEAEVRKLLGLKAEQKAGS